MTRRRPASSKARACDGKAQHATRADAAHAMRALIARGAPRGRLNVYQCAHGRHWHVGHTPRGKR